MVIAVASGKGGTGKTTVAVSLALALTHRGSGADREPALPLLVDCDVEAPNAALFVDFDAEQSRDVVQLRPEVDPDACDLCGRCAEVCAFHALAVIGRRVLVFPELCHGCGSCGLSCPTRAIREVGQATGRLERGRAGALDLAHGRIDVGVAMPVPAIRQLKRWAIDSRDRANGRRTVIIDAPPGTSCPVVESIREADFVLLVTEPTPFGEHDLRLAVEVARDELGLPVGVVVNRSGTDYDGIEEYCEAAGVPVLLRIPHDRRIAEAYSDGVPLVRAMPEYRRHFAGLYERITELVSNGGRSAEPRSAQGGRE
jgi:MinD superfamily P-loop ATPase